MRYRFHPEALEEYQEAVNWYAQRGNPPAQRFVEAVEDSIRRIVEAPERWRVIEEDVRRCLTKLFPYGVLYTIEPEFVLIIADALQSTARLLAATPKESLGSIQQRLYPEP